MSLSAGVRSLLPVYKYASFRESYDLRTVADLPKQYQKFYREWKGCEHLATPVHWIPRKERWIRNPDTGEVKPVQNHPIPVTYPHQMHEGIWGGEGVVEGLVKKKKYRSPVSRFWVPKLQKTVVYSEILDTYFSVVVTERALELIDKHDGLDSYLLQTPAYDLKSLLALKLKRALLLALHDKTFCLDDPTKQEVLLNKYKELMIPRDEIEWYGYSVDEALAKFNKLRKEQHLTFCQPMKHELRALHLQRIRSQEEEVSPDSPKKSWVAKLNPFGKPAHVQ